MVAKTLASKWPGFPVGGLRGKCYVLWVGEKWWENQGKTRVRLQPNWAQVEGKLENWGLQRKRDGCWILVYLRSFRLSSFFLAVDWEWRVPLPQAHFLRPPRSYCPSIPPNIVVKSQPPFSDASSQLAPVLPDFASGFALFSHCGVCDFGFALAGDVALDGGLKAPPPVDPALIFDAFA